MAPNKKACIHMQAFLFESQTFKKLKEYVCRSTMQSQRQTRMQEW
jgi:hypothetical protein